MSKRIPFASKFPATHPKKGAPTHFPEMILNELGIDYRDDAYYEWLCEYNHTKDKEMLESFFLRLNPDITDKKPHTIRQGDKVKAGDVRTPFVWSGKPYNSPQIVFAPDITILKTYDFEITNKYKEGVWIDFGMYHIHPEYMSNQPFISMLAKNDGLTLTDLLDWFKYPKPFSGQILVYGNNVNY